MSRSPTPRPPPWQVAAPQLPPATPLRNAHSVSDEDIWTPDVPVTPQSVRPQKGSGRGLLVTLFLVLFLSGAGIALGWPYLMSYSAVTVTQEPLPPPWSPGKGPLVEGVALDGASPRALRWSEAGDKVGWVVFDPAAGRRLAFEVQVTDTFGEITYNNEAMEWIQRGPDTSQLHARAEQGLVIISKLPNGPGVHVDLRKSLGLLDVSTPALYTRGAQTWLAVVGKGADPLAPPTLHVLEVTSRLAPPPAPAAPPG